MPASRIPDQTSPSSCGGSRSFIKGRQTPARKHRPDLAGSWLLRYSAGNSRVPLYKGLAARQRDVLDCTHPCTLLPLPAFSLTPGRSRIQPCSAQIPRSTSLPPGVLMPIWGGTGCGLTVHPQELFPRSSISQHTQKILGHIFLGTLCSQKPARAVPVGYPCWEQDTVGEGEAAPHPPHHPKTLLCLPKGQLGFFSSREEQGNSAPRTRTACSCS